MNGAHKAAEAAPFIRRQYEFAASIRDPEGNPAPADVKPERMAVYQELFFNNVNGFLANSFPVIRQIYSDDAWNRLVRDYFASHESHSPLFLQMPAEFLQYLETERQADDDPVFLTELAHYEWVELALSIDTREIDSQPADSGGDLLEGRPVLNELAWPLAYRFPVHQIGPDYQPEAVPEEPSYLVVYRNREDDVKFMALNPVSARLLELLGSNTGSSGRQILVQIAEELDHPQPEAVISAGLEILKDMQARDIVLGTAL